MKIVVLGAEGSGKSSVLLRADNDSFDGSMAPTLGYNHKVFFSSDIQNESHLSITEVSGAPGFLDYRLTPIRTADLCIYCVDLTKPFGPSESEIAALKEEYDFLEIFLVGTKSDLEQDRNTRNNLIAFAVKEGIKKPFITSAKDNINIQQLFEEIHEFNCSLDNTVVEDTSHSEPVACESLLNQSLMTLNSTVNTRRLLTNSQRDCILQEIDTLVASLGNMDLSIDQKQQAIQTFEDNCNDAISESVPMPLREKVLNAVAAVAVAALVTVLAAAIGFGMGFAAGLWTGPGAFISGVLAGGTAAVTVAAASASLGVGAGTISAHGLFKPTKIIPEEYAGLSLDIFGAAWAARQDFRCPSPSL